MSLRHFAIAVFVALAPAAHAQLVNGSFENINNTFVDFSNPQGDFGAMQLQPTSTDITGWTTIGNEMAWERTPNFYNLTASNGSYFLDLTGYHDGQPEGGVRQTVGGLGVGAEYRLSFDVGYSSIYPTSGDGVVLTVGSVSQTFLYSGPTTLSNSWQTFTYDFMAVEDSMNVQFLGSPTAIGAYIGLDNVTLVQTSGSPTPEAGTLALLAAGAIPLVGVLRRHTR